MKKIIFACIVVFSLASCSDATMSDAVVVEQINVTEGSTHKYQVKLKTDVESNDVYYNTNHRFQVGDTLISYYEFFDGKNQDIRKLSRERDSLKKELEVALYYLEILKERVIIDTLKRR